MEISKCVAKILKCVAKISEFVVNSKCVCSVFEMCCERMRSDPCGPT